MLNAWVYAIAVEGWSDLSLVCTPSQLGNLNCFNEREGVASTGWGCLFTDMPHLCKFNKNEVKLMEFTISVGLGVKSCFVPEGSMFALFASNPA